MAFRQLKAISLVTVSLCALSACSWLSESPASGNTYSRIETNSAATPEPPQTRVMQTAQGTWLAPEQGVKPVATAAELAELKQANTRINQLETEMASLRNDMKMMMPALTKLAGGPSMETTLNDIQPAAGGSVAAGEMTRIHRNYMQADSSYDPEIEMDEQSAYIAPPPPMTPQAPLALVPSNPQQPQTQIAVPSPVRLQPASYTPPTLNVSSIKGVRFGSHEGGKSRMVIDVSSAPAFTYDIDNNEKILMIEIPGTVWNAGPVTKLIQDNPLIQSLAASPDGQGGTRVVLQLAAPAKILWSQAIPPSGTQGHRIVLDIAAN